MSNNRDFERKSQSLIDVGEFYSDNLVIFTETDEDRWERFCITNPIGSSLIIEIFGLKDAKLLLPHIKPTLVDDKLLKIAKEAKLGVPEGKEGRISPTFFRTRILPETYE